MTVIQNITTGLHNTKSTPQALESLKLLEARGVSNHLTTPIDKVDVQHTTLADPSNHVYVLEAGSGQKAVLTFSEKTSEVSALLVSKDGSSKSVSNENLPKDLKMIKNLDSFNGFLENAQAIGAVLSDGEAKLYVQQKGVGGSGPGERACYVKSIASGTNPISCFKDGSGKSEKGGNDKGGSKSGGAEKGGKK